MKQKQLDELKAVCNTCKKCPLWETRTNVVFGSGNANAKILFIGEAPGRSEDEQGLPFVGASGKLLDKYLDAIGLSREDAYIANILKCRPPNNRDPKPEEEEQCIGYLREQLRIINPTVIVCLGRISAFKIIKPDFKITQEHGQWFSRGGVQMTAIYHPAALLRDVSKRPETFEDLKAIQSKVRELCDHTHI